MRLIATNLCTALAKNHNITYISVYVCVCMHKYLERAVHKGLVQVNDHTVLAVIINADLRQEVFGWRLKEIIRYR